MVGLEQSEQKNPRGRDVIKVQELDCIEPCRLLAPQGTDVKLLEFEQGSDRFNTSFLKITLVTVSETRCKGTGKS